MSEARSRMMREDQIIRLRKEYDRIRIKKGQTFGEINKLIEWGVSSRGEHRQQLEKELRQYQDEYDVVVQKLYDALIKLFEENDKYKCPYCGGNIGVYIDRYAKHDRFDHLYTAIAYGYGCTKCNHHDYPMDEEPIQALITWYKICQHESDKALVLKRWESEDERK